MEVFRELSGNETWVIRFLCPEVTPQSGDANGLNPYLCLPEVRLSSSAVGISVFENRYDCR